MMGSQAIADEADTLLSIIADNDKYKAKIKEMKELAQAITAEKDRLAKAQTEPTTSQSGRCQMTGKRSKKQQPKRKPTSRKRKPRATKPCRTP